MGMYVDSWNNILIAPCHDSLNVLDFLSLLDVDGLPITHLVNLLSYGHNIKNKIKLEMRKIHSISNLAL